MKYDAWLLREAFSRLCVDINIEVADLYALSGVAKSTVDNFMRGKSDNLRPETLKKIIEVFEMEEDEFENCLYAIKAEGRPSDEEALKRRPGEIISKRLNAIRKRRKQTLAMVSEATEIPIDYETRLRETDFSLLISIAEYFDVSLDYLAGRTDDPGAHKYSSPITFFEADLNYCSGKKILIEPEAVHEPVKYPPPRKRRF